MAHPVVDGSVSLVKCVTPGAYWIRCAHCSGSCSIPNSIKEKPYAGEYYPPQGAEVFVRDSTDDLFYRGIVKGRRQYAQSPHWKYVVQLTDTFQVCDFRPEDVFPTYGSKNVSCDSAHLVSLDGILPPEVRNDFKESELKSFAETSGNWCSKSSVVEKFLCHVTNLIFEQSSMIDGSIYGKLTASGSYYSNVDLSDFVVREGIGLKSERRFNEIVTMLKRPVKLPGLLPTFDPKLGFTGEGSDQPPDKKEYDYSKFKVLDVDKELHSSLSKPFSINLLFTQRPSKDDVIVRFVAPDGCVVIGTVMNVPLHFYDAPEFGIIDTSKPKILKPLTRRVNGCTEEFDPGVQSKSSNMLLYNHNSAVRRFVEEGGIISDYSTSASARKIQLAAEFFEEIQHLLNMTELKSWQKACLPSLLNGNKVLLIGPKGEGKLTMTLISILSTMEIGDAGGPICIVLCPDHARADQAASIIARSSQCKKLLLTTSRISDSQKSEITEGCDILVTMPNHIMQLVDDGCCHLGRLLHVVYDSFESLVRCSRNLERFNNLICHKFPKTQIIYCSNVWDSTILDFVHKPYTCCVFDRILSSFYRGVTARLIVSPADDLISQLVDTVNKRKIKKGLILCNDDHELRLICRALSDFDDISAVWETSAEEEAQKSINSWDDGSNSLLICNDRTFSQCEISAQLLISWKAQNRDTLNKRFSAIDKNVSSDEMLNVLLFCDCKNYDELILMNDLLLNEDLEPYLNDIYCEEQKKRSSSLCPQLLMFGNCLEKFSCVLRHAFIDESLVFTRKNQYLVGTVLEIHSAFHFSFRVKKVVSNQSCTADLARLTSVLSEIEEALAIAYRNRNRGRTASFEVGDIAGAVVVIAGKQAFRRVRIDSVGPVFLVEMLDFFESRSFVESGDLFSIPDDVALLPPDVVDVFICGLVPTDRHSDWTYESKNFLLNFIKMLRNDGNSCFLAGAVCAVVNRSVIVDSVRLAQQQSDITLEYASLKDVILDVGLAAMNNDHLKILSELAISCGTLSSIPHQSNGRLGCRANLPDDFVLATVPALDDPGLFFVQLEDDREDLTALENRLSHTMKRSARRLSCVVVDDLCAFESDGVWNRAVVLQASPQPVEIMCVDHGDIRVVSLEELFELPDEFHDFPYFAIECQLTGIKPARGDTWSDDAVRLFSNILRCENDFMKLVFVKFQGVVKYANKERYYDRHQVLIKQTQNPDGVAVNLRLVSHGLATWDVNTRHLVTNTSKGKPSSVA